MKGRILVLGGGWSGERPISLLSMQGVVPALRGRGWKVLACDLVPDGPLRTAPRATPAYAKRLPLSRLIPQCLAYRPRAVFLALHGPMGEDGRIQGLLDLAGIPYAGSDALSSALAMDKGLAKQLLAAAGIKVPDGLRLAKGQGLPARLPLPCVVKPVAQGSSLGITLARSRAQARLGLRAALRWDKEALIEPYIRGREFAVGVLGGRALPLVEIVPINEFYDYHSKYAEGGSRHLCPAPLPAAQSARLRVLGLKAHRVLGCRGFSRVDILLDRSGRAWVLEVNTLPGLTNVSLLPDAAKAAGLAYGQLLEEMIRASAGKGPWASTKG